MSSQEQAGLRVESAPSRPAGPALPFRDDRVRMAIYVAVLVLQIVVVYAIFAWWV